MKKVLRIMVAGIMLFSGMHISLDRHYCGGNLVNIRLSFTGKSASCGMEETGYACEVSYGFNRKCCEDKASFLGSDSEYLPEYAQVIYQPGSKTINGTLFTYSSPGQADNRTQDQRVMPPGIACVPVKRQTGLCVFRI
jgi:hypothetical protein